MLMMLMCVQWQFACSNAWIIMGIIIIFINIQYFVFFSFYLKHAHMMMMPLADRSFACTASFWLLLFDFHKHVRFCFHSIFPTLSYSTHPQQCHIGPPMDALIDIYNFHSFSIFLIFYCLFVFHVKYSNYESSSL